MVVRAATRATRHRPRPSKNKLGVLPPPIKGVDSRISLAANDLSVCPYTYNIMPSEDGMEVRKGYREHVIGVQNTASTGIGTMIPFEDVSGAADKLFAVNNEGIWDVTAFDTSPTQKATFTVDTSAAAGHGMFINYVDVAGAQFILYADNLNGLWTYTASTNSWAATTGITGVTISNVVGIVVHKLRVWLFEKDSTVVYYMPIDAIAGAATAFHFGSKFSHGGYVAGIMTWTLDGGNGVDDYFVVVSSSGDILPYQGEDPSSASTWVLRGSYHIGAMPAGYRSFIEYSGELYIISAFGLVSMHELLRGANPELPGTENIAFKISKVLQDSMKTLRSSHGWSLKFLPSEGLLILVSPVQSDGVYIQYVLNLTTKAWGFWRGVPILSAVSWQNVVYFGTSDDRVMVMDVDIDGVTLAAPATGDVNGEAIEYSLLHSFSDFEAPAVMKRGVFIRPNFRAYTPPVFEAKFLYDYEIDEFSASLSQPASNIGTWDSGVWDASTWAGGALKPFFDPVGGAGLGRTMAVAIRGTSRAPTLLVSTDVIWNAGSFL